MTAYEMRISDWSSDVCSSDLRRPGPVLTQCVSYRPGAKGGPCSAPRIGAGGGANRKGRRHCRCPQQGNSRIERRRVRFYRLCGTAGCADARTRDGIETTRTFACRSERSEEHTSELQSLMRISY